MQSIACKSPRVLELYVIHYVRIKLFLPQAAQLEIPFFHLIISSGATS